MSEEITECPICQWKGTRQQYCPQCGWELESGYILGGLDEETKQEFERQLQEARKQWQEKYFALFGGDCQLFIITNEDAEIFIDGYSIGKTKNCCLLVENLRAGKHRIEAKARYSYGVVEKEIEPGDIQRCKIRLQPGKGILRVLSEVGLLTLHVDGRSYQVPAQIEVQAGHKLLRVEGSNWFRLAKVEVLPKQIVNVRITQEWLQDCGRVLNEHKDWVQCVIFSPKSRLLASASRDRTVCLWEVSTGEKIDVLKHTDRVYSVSFSPDGRLLASGSGNGTISLWEISTRKCIAVLEGHKGVVYSVSFSRDGRLLASGGGDGTICLWEINDGNRVNILERYKYYVHCITFSPNKQLMALGSDDGIIRLWEISTRRYITLEGHSDVVYSVSFSPDGSLLASGSGDRTIRLWEISTGKCIITLTGHESSVYSISFSPDGSLLASGSGDRTIRLWNIDLFLCE